MVRTFVGNAENQIQNLPHKYKPGERRCQDVGQKMEVSKLITGTGQEQNL
jgi:hypothetical protein